MSGRVHPARVVCALIAACVVAVPVATAAPRPITAAFYYAWYPETWRPAPHATPSLGHYRSPDQRVIRTHLRELHRAHIQAAIVSWWGIGDRSDGRFRHLLRVTRRLRSPVRLAIYYEPEGVGDPSVVRLACQIKCSSSSELRVTEARTLSSMPCIRTVSTP